MGVASFDDIITRISNDYTVNQPIWNELQTATVTANNLSINRVGRTKLMPSLPSGVTSYIPTAISLIGSTSNALYLAGKLVSLGTWNLSTATFTDGSAMPQQTVFGTASTYVPSPVILEVTTALNATPGGVSVTYTDQSGNSTETAAFSWGASSPIGTCMWLPLNSPDWGVRDITNVTQSGGTSPTGACKLYGIVPFGLFYSVGSGGAVESMLTYDFCFNELGAGDEIGVFGMMSSATKAVMGHIFIVGDS